MYPFLGILFSPLNLVKSQIPSGDHMQDNHYPLLQYDNGTKEIEMSTSHIYGFNTSAPGTYTVTVKYMVEEENYLAITTYEITVTE